VNTRGDYVSTRVPSDITEAMRRILASVSSGDTPSGSIALTGARIGDSSLSVVPRYEVKNEGTDWFSELQAHQIEINALGQVAEFSEAWEASEKIPSPVARNVFFARDNNTVARFQDTETSITLSTLCTKPTSYLGMSRCTAAELSALGVDAPAAIRYLLGENTREVKNSGTLRDRTTDLGDIVNSTPVVSSPLDDYGYRSLTGTIGTSYAAFLNNKRTDSTRYMVYVGANDGMLHAFDGGMTAENEMDPGAGGTEVFGYIPTTAIGHIGNLLFPYDAADRSDQKFAHRYYVDGPVTVSDACLGTCAGVASWRTVLVGTAGAGGRSVFALNVTDPDLFAASDRLWEISDLNSTLAADVRANIGHVLGEPVIVPVKTRAGISRWKAILGTRYNRACG
jgi:type IV pilus assembly protein PilY1